MFLKFSVLARLDPTENIRVLSIKLNWYEHLSNLLYNGHMVSVSIKMTFMFI